MANVGKRARCEVPFAPDGGEHWPSTSLQDFSHVSRLPRGRRNQSLGASRTSRVADRYGARPVVQPA